jgi:tRNA A-37 threonylcarbamoyl transferase component Bud32
MDGDAWRQAKGVLAEALLRPASERDALVADRCPDPSLRRELQSFLNQYDEDFLESVLTISQTFDGTAGASDAPDQALDIEIGDRVGPYIVLDRLGAGGMGQVFLGNDIRLHRKVALKCLSASASASELRARVLHEARAAARITHPNIAIVHDVVEHEGRPFLVMEYVEGESLAFLMKRERPTVPRMLDMLRQLASALAAAHGKGIVHRDLKPANIQVTPEGSVKILDCGVAHAISAAATGATSGVMLTVPMPTTSASGERRIMHPGTPAYMSPEQMFGREIDQRSDIYSLGVIVYEMATGHRPYATDNPVDVVLTLSKNFLTTGDPERTLPAQLTGVVGKMLAVKPEERFQTAGELENALLTIVTTPAAPVVVPSRPTAALRVAGRVAFLALVAVVGLTFLGYIVTLGFNLTLERVPPFDRESPLVWLQYGVRALVVPAVYTVLVFIAIAAIRFVIRVLSLSRGIEHLLTTSITRTSRLSSRLGLDDPAVLSQAVAGLGIVALGLALHHFWPFILAYGTRTISTQPTERFLPLQPRGASRLDAQLYRFVFTLFVFGFGMALVRIHRLRATRAVREGGLAFALVGVMFAIALGLCVAPYRIVWQNEAPRYDVAGERCFAIGESSEQLLLHCPDRVPPRNRVVRRDDSALHATGVRQNIFTPPDTSQ